MVVGRGDAALTRALLASVAPARRGRLTASVSVALSLWTLRRQRKGHNMFVKKRRLMMGPVHSPGVYGFATAAALHAAS